MTRRRLALLIGTVIVLVAAGVFVGSARSVGGPSSLSHRSTGLLVAQQYLSATGTETVLLDHSLASGIDADVLVIAFPAAVPMSPEEIAGVETFLKDGKTVIAAYSSTMQGFSERALLREHGVSSFRLDDEVRLNPVHWWRQANSGWSIAAVDTHATIDIGRPIRIPEPPAEAVVLYTDSDGTAGVFALGSGAGHFVLVPAAALSNSGIGDAGGCDLLARLQGTFPGTWAFDEYRHGLSTGVDDDISGAERSFDLLIAQLLLGYVLALVTLGRRFGPAWPDQRTTTSSTSSFLMDLGWYHERLGHHQDAAQSLIQRAVELDPRILNPPSAEGVTTSNQLVELARRLTEPTKPRRDQ